MSGIVSSMIYGINGMIAGTLLTPPAMALGAGIGEVISRAANLPPEQRQIAWGVGAVTGAATLTALLNVSPFSTGFKIAAVTLSAIVGGVSGSNPAKKRDSKFLVWPMAGAATGIFIGVIGTAAVGPVPGCCLGAVSAYVISAGGNAYAPA